MRVTATLPPPEMMAHAPGDDGSSASQFRPQIQHLQDLRTGLGVALWSTMKVDPPDSLPNVELQELSLVTGGVLNKARCFLYRMGALKKRLGAAAGAANFPSLADYSAAQRALEEPEPSYCSSIPEPRNLKLPRLLGL